MTSEDVKEYRLSVPSVVQHTLEDCGRETCVAAICHAFPDVGCPLFQHLRRVRRPLQGPLQCRATVEGEKK